MSGPLGEIYTFDEAAALLRVSKTAFQGIIKRHPFYAKNGRVYLFSESDIRSIWEAMRCPSNSSNDLHRITGTCAGPSEARVSSRLRELTTRRGRKRSA